MKFGPNWWVKWKGGLHEGLGREIRKEEDVID